jgi:hypothetical protein
LVIYSLGGCYRAVLFAPPVRFRPSLAGWWVGEFGGGGDNIPPRLPLRESV